MTNKLYLNDSYLREIKTTVVKSEKIDDQYHTVLDSTIFYPDNVGGQPGDIGTINGIEVIKSYVDGDDIVHITNEEIIDDEITMKIDWNNRFDIMQQHTGQHLLSNSFYRLLNGRTLSVHLSADYSTIDIDVDSISDEELLNVENLCNTVVQSNFDIVALYPNDEELASMNLRKEPTVTENIRILDIGGIDLTPCGGTHLSTTGEIGLIKIVSYEKQRNYLRFKFLNGLRAIADYDMKNKAALHIASSISSAPEQLMENFDKISAKKTELEDNYRHLKQTLFQYMTKYLLENAQTIAGVRYIIKPIEDISFKDMNYLSNTISSEGKVVQIYYLPNTSTAQILVTVSEDLNVDLREVLNQLKKQYEFRGGGNQNTVQGTVIVENLESVINAFKSIIREKLIIVF